MKKRSSRTADLNDFKENLQNFLHNQKEEEISLTIDELREKDITVPPSGQRFPNWWDNRSSRGDIWTEIGWTIKVSTLNNEIKEISFIKSEVKKDVSYIDAKGVVRKYSRSSHWFLLMSILLGIIGLFISVIWLSQSMNLVLSNLFNFQIFNIYLALTIIGFVGIILEAVCYYYLIFEPKEFKNLKKENLYGRVGASLMFLGTLGFIFGALAFVVYILWDRLNNKLICLSCGMELKEGLNVCPNCNKDLK